MDVIDAGWNERRRAESDESPPFGMERRGGGDRRRSGRARRAPIDYVTPWQLPPGEVDVTAPWRQESRP